jgi:hypothetical protein
MRLTVAIVGTTLSLVGATVAIHAAKPAASVSCSVQMRDAVGDIVRSDGGGTYTNGAGGVSCSIDGFSKWLVLGFSSPGKHQPPRSLVVVGQGDMNGSSPYSTVSSSTELDIMLLGEAVSPTDVLHWRLRMSSAPQFLGSFGQLTGDSTYGAGNPGVGTSSLVVTTVDACTWVATSYASYPLQTIVGGHGENASTQTDPRVAILTENGIPGGNGAIVRGYYVTPFAATIRALKTGCPL